MSALAATPRRRAAARPALRLSVQRAAGGDLPTRAQLRAWLLAALERSASVTLRLVDEAEGRALNAAYRGKDYATNVLTFGYGEEAWGAGSGECGDLVLCAPVVEREAVEQGKPPAAHWAHLVVHGALHLQGYDHENEDEARVMEGREREIMARLGFPDPYAAG